MRGWWRIAVFVVVLLALCAGGLLAGRLAWNGTDQVLIARRDLADALGLRVDVSGSVEFHAFPRPHITATGISVSDASGALKLDIPSAGASIAFGSLLRGRIVVEDLRLTNPTGVVDLDALAAQETRSAEGPVGSSDWTDRLPARIVVVSGLIQLQSATPAASGIVSELQMAVSGLPTGSVAFNGRSSWHGSHAEFAGQFDGLRSFMESKPTAGSVRFKSRDLSLSLTGTLAEGRRGRFTGVAAASTASLPGVLRLAGLPTQGTAGIQHASFTGSAEQTDDGLTFSNARLVLNTTTLEGTLALQRNGGLVGTLATDVLDFTPFLRGLPHVFDADGRWSAEPFDFTPSALHDVDLRISANQVDVGRFRADDAAFSALCRDGRLELSLGEARAYGGMVKARLLASSSDTGVQVKIDASASRLSLDQTNSLLNTGSGTLDGSATAHFAVEGRGNSVQTLVATSWGHGQVGIRQGRVSGLPELRVLLGPAGEGAGASPDPATFDLITATGEVDRGRMTIKDGSIEGTGGPLVLSGNVSLLDRTYRLSSAKPAATAPAGANASETTGRFPVSPGAAESEAEGFGRPLSAADSNGGAYFP